MCSPREDLTENANKSVIGVQREKDVQEQGKKDEVWFYELQFSYSA